MATKPVVVGVDGSEESMLAAEWAALGISQTILRSHIRMVPEK